MFCVKYVYIYACICLPICVCVSLNFITWSFHKSKGIFMKNISDFTISSCGRGLGLPCLTNASKM